MAASWKVIECVLKEHAPVAYKSLRPPASADRIAALEEKIGARLPQGLVASLRIHDGMRGYLSPGASLVNYKTLLPTTAIATQWKMLWDLQRECEFPGDGMSRTRKVRNDAHWRAGWVPVMASVIGDLLVLDLDPAPAGARGQLFQWYNSGCVRMKVVAGSFTAWLDALADELERGRFTVDDLGEVRLRRRLA